MESVIARVLKDPKQSIKGMRLLCFARNDRGLVSDLERSPTRKVIRPGRGCNPQCKKGLCKALIAFSP